MTNTAIRINPRAMQNTVVAALYDNEKDYAVFRITAKNHETLSTMLSDVGSGTAESREQIVTQEKVGE